jgi:hypothetical protein
MGTASLDFMRLLKSLEELLYEVVSWLVFYPITMARSVTRPMQMMRYADVELADRPEDQYDDTLSPPLFLLITLLLAQALSSALPSVYDPATAPRVLSSGSNLLIARGIIFSVFPLVMAVTLLRWKSVRLTRHTLRPPFFSQCYVVAPFVLAAGLAMDLMLIPQQKGLAAGIVAMLGALAWYGYVEVKWFRRDLGVGLARAAFLFLRALLIAFAAILALALLIAWGLENWTA